MWCLSIVSFAGSKGGIFPSHKSLNAREFPHDSNSPQPPHRAKSTVYQISYLMTGKYIYITIVVKFLLGYFYSKER